jgi:hypothetical protein
MPSYETIDEVSRLKMSSLKSYTVGRSLISYENFYLSEGLSDGRSKIDFFKKYIFAGNRKDDFSVSS